ncbi:MAG: Ig domain protein group 2 domain protein [Fibrobacteres bacterium]|nr:Ig domain protein group 2 domain protein [Fibrobacterota bacterium]
MARNRALLRIDHALMRNAALPMLARALPMLLGALSASAATYYVDAAAGNDDAAGTAPALAWKSLPKANGAALKAGDSLLFKSGGMWTGQLHPKGSGEAGNPIVIAAYGGAQKALINGNGLIGQGVLYLNAQSDWDIGGLEITDEAGEPADRRGVSVVGPGARIRLHDLFVHHISGTPALPQFGDGNLAAKATGGIAFSGGGADILVENCEIFHVDNTGLFTDKGRYPGLRVRNNVVHDIAKNAMIIRGADSESVIEYNVCYQTCVRGVITGNTIFSSNCKGTTFQYNEGYLNNSTGGHDGSLYDCDINGGSDTKWQYSYSHDNNHGLMWFCTNADDVGIKVRYNISQNDKGRIFTFAFPLGHADIYNNTVFIGPDANPVILYEEGQKYGYSFRNNIIYNLSKGAGYHYGNAARLFDYNVFYGQHPAGEPADPHKITADPMFAAPGSGKIGIGSVAGYGLLPGSPCINSGMAIPENGGRDYAGNPIYQGPDRGAFEWQGGTSLTDPASAGPGRIPVPYSRNPGTGPRLIFPLGPGREFDALGKR